MDEDREMSPHFSSPGREAEENPGDSSIYSVQRRGGEGKDVRVAVVGKE